MNQRASVRAIAEKLSEAMCDLVAFGERQDPGFLNRAGEALAAAAPPFGKIPRQDAREMIERALLAALRAPPERPS